MSTDKNIQEWLFAKHTLETALKAPSCENRLGHILALNAVNSALVASLKVYIESMEVLSYNIVEAA